MLSVHAAIVRQSSGLFRGRDLTGAEEVLRAVQVELRRWAPPGNHWDRGQAREIARDLDWARMNALATLIDSRGDSAAKCLELAVADGAPLALCVGTLMPAFEVESEAGTRSFQAGGCLHTFADSVRTSGPSSQMWPRWCPECRKRKPVRDAKRRLQSQVDRRRYPGVAKGGRPFRLAPDEPG